MIVVIDNYDSFTWNLVDLLRQSHHVVAVFRNDELTANDLMNLHPKGILISPGPGRPADSGISPEVLRLAMGGAQNQGGPKVSKVVPVLGICLGHQLIGEHFGMPLLLGRVPVHGKTSPVFHRGEGLFEGLPSPFEAMRYHSLVLDGAAVPAELEVTAWTEPGEVMGIRHRSLPIAGVQFHPESILTVGGATILGNWVKELGAKPFFPI
ncbi:MAG: aminodeoxychorismate/anthranilate synthase component II [Bacteroidetes bacterium]|nr:aminodeoxychorismate/anthranilate synthase component II [Bacteroidota bacterium]